MIVWVKDEEKQQDESFLLHLFFTTEGTTGKGTREQLSLKGEGRIERGKRELLSLKGEGHGWGCSEKSLESRCQSGATCFNSEQFK